MDENGNVNTTGFDKLAGSKTDSETAAKIANMININCSKLNATDKCEKAEELRLCILTEIGKLKNGSDSQN